MSSLTIAADLTLQLMRHCDGGGVLVDYKRVPISTVQDACDVMAAAQTISGLTLCGNVLAGDTTVAGINTYGDIWQARTGTLLAKRGVVHHPHFFHVS